MRRLFFNLVMAATALLVANAAFAQETANVSAQHALLVNAGFSAGGFALGIDYENGVNRTFGLGGYIRMNPDDTDRGVAEVNAFGVFIRPHFTRQAWDLYVSPGFGIVQYDQGRTDETTFGPVLMLGLMYQISGQAAIGVEHTSIYAWLEEDIRGQVSEELLAKFRFSF